jgi:hypothetical protein
LQRIYSDIHAAGLPSAGEPAETLFAGNSLLPFIETIRALVQASGAHTLLDYGSGKAVIHKQASVTLPNGKTIDRVHDYWGVSGVTFYDPGVSEYSQLPQGRFDGVISTDVLEHIPEEDIPWVLSEMFGYGEKFVFANIASYPAQKTLPNGWNAHVTIKPPAWWREQIARAAMNWPGRDYLFIVSEKRGPLDKLIAKITARKSGMKRTEICKRAA